MHLKSIFLKNIPEDIYLFLLKEQNRHKEQKQTNQYSMERTIYGFIRESKQFKESLNK